MWEIVTLDVTDSREQELVSSLFGLALDKGVLFRRHNNTIESARYVFWAILKNRYGTFRIKRSSTTRNVSKRWAAGKELLGVLDRHGSWGPSGDVDDEETRRELRQEVLGLREYLATPSRASAGP